MNHIPCTLEPKFRRRLATLARHLEGRKRRGLIFDMNFFFKPEDGGGINSHEVSKHNVCGSTACALGEAALIFPKIADESGGWNSFLNLVFGIKRERTDWSNGGEMFTPEWKWLFTSDWCTKDNTRKGAAARIRYFLKHGVPVNFHEQIYKDAPLCYKVD